MTSPYLPVPDGVAPTVVDMRSSFTAIHHDIAEAVRGYPQPVVPASSPPETQTALSFSSGWVNFGNGYQPAGYQQVGTRVFLRGLVSNLTAMTGPVGILSMPAGVRPALNEIFAQLLGDTTPIRIQVHSDGNVVAYGSIPVNSYITLSGITYSTLA